MQAVSDEQTTDSNSKIHGSASSETPIGALLEQDRPDATDSSAAKRRRARKDRRAIVKSTVYQTGANNIVYGLCEAASEDAYMIKGGKRSSRADRVQKNRPGLDKDRSISAARKRDNSGKRKKDLDIPDENPSLLNRISRLGARVGPGSSKHNSSRSGVWGDAFSFVTPED